MGDSGAGIVNPRSRCSVRTKAKRQSIRKKGRKTWYYVAMFWKCFTPDEWSAFGTVLSAGVASLNLIVVIILVAYNRMTINLLKEQSRDTRAQAQVAIETLSELKSERKLLAGRRVLRAYGRLQDLNDIFLIAKGEIEKELFKAADHNPLMPDDWHDISIVVMESWPQGIERTAVLERKIREIQMDVSFLCKPLNPQTARDGTAHLVQLLGEALELLREIGPGMLHHVTGQRIPTESVNPAVAGSPSATSST